MRTNREKHTAKIVCFLWYRALPANFAKSIKHKATLLTEGLRSGEKYMIYFFLYIFFPAPSI